jgi:hypothetical protein
MTVHHIHVEHGRAAALHRADAVAQAGEIRRQDGRGNLDGVSHHFSAHILPD